MQVPWQFNANQYEPNQGMAGHPPALKIPFTITNTAIAETKDKTGAMLVVDLTSTLGVMVQRYNIHNSSPKAVEIAYGQLSALCRATGRFNLDGQNECAALRGGQGLMDIGYQKDEEPNPQFPDRKGYTELKRVYDVNGNDPSKPNAVPQQGQQGGFGGQPQGQAQPQQSQPMTQQGNGSWGSGQPQQNAPQGQPQGQQQPNPQQGQPGQAWQPSGQTGGNVPWGNRT